MQAVSLLSVIHHLHVYITSRIWRGRRDHQYYELLSLHPDTHTKRQDTMVNLSAIRVGSVRCE